MRFSPTKLLHGLLYTAPVMLLTLVACGGGGGGPGSTFVAAYTLGGTVSGLTSGGLVLRNNGGDDKAISSVDATYVFNTSVVAGNTYNVSVLTHPSTPSHQKCTVSPANASGTMPASNVANVDVTCVPAYTIGGTISGLASNGLVLQNNLGDNFLAASGVNGFTFSTPIAASGSYAVTVLAQPYTPAKLLCTPTSASGSNLGANITNVLISCAPDPAPAADRYVYTANFDSDSVSAYSTEPVSGVLAAKTVNNPPGVQPSAVASDGAGHLYVTNHGSNSISGYNIEVNGALTAMTDVDAGTPNSQSIISTGPSPAAIKIHPSGKFAYVANSGGGFDPAANSISAYSIDGSSGALAKIDTDAAVGTQYFIKTKETPRAIAFHPGGGYAYVANYTSGNVTLYSINALGALAEIETITTGTTPYSIAVDTAGTYAYVTSWNTDMVWKYTIGAADGKLTSGVAAATGNGPRAIEIDPSGTHAYVVNSSSGNISAYNIGAGGVLTTVTNSPFSTGNNPISISIDSSGKFAYVVNSTDNNVSVFSINVSGELNLEGTSATGLSPYSVTTVK